MNLARTRMMLPTGCPSLMLSSTSWSGSVTVSRIVWSSAYDASARIFLEKNFFLSSVLLFASSSLASLAGGGETFPTREDTAIQQKRERERVG